MSGLPYIWRADDSVEIKARARNGNKVSSLLGRTGWLYAASDQPSLPQFSTNKALQHIPRHMVCNFDGMEIILLGKARVVGIEYDTTETGMNAYLYCMFEGD